MISMLASQSAMGYMVPWSFLFATALVASALDAFAKRPFNPVVMTAWFFGLTVAGSMGAWSIPEIAAGAICLLTPHLLICSVASRSERVGDSESFALAEAVPGGAAAQGGPISFEPSAADADEADADTGTERTRRAA